MTLLRTFPALLAGFLTMALMVGLATAVLMKCVPEWVGTAGQPRAGYIFVNLGYSFAATIAGGYMTVWLSRDNPLIHAFALALVVLL